MIIRPVTSSDLVLAAEIDGTIESLSELLVQSTGEGLSVAWTLQQQDLAQKRIRSNPLVEDRLFDVKQIVSGADEGNALLAEHEQVPIGLLVWRTLAARQTLELIDLRVDSDYRRQGIASAMLYEMIRVLQETPDAFRAISAVTESDNAPANALLHKCGFELVGIDRNRFRHSPGQNGAALLWYRDLMSLT